MGNEVTVKFAVPRVHPSINVWAYKWHWSKRQKEREIWDILVQNEWRKLNKIRFKGSVQVHIEYRLKATRIRDFDNYSPKFLLDSLKQTFIVDDNIRIVKAPTWDLVPDAKQRTIITITGEKEV